MNQFKISDMHPQAHTRTPLLQRLAWAATLLMLATVLLSAAIRLDPAASTVALARGAHRVVATLVLVLAVALLALAPHRGDAGDVRLSRALLAAVVALALLGVVTPGAKAPAVVVGNLLGGFAVFVLCLRLAWRPAPQAPLPPRRLVLAAVEVLVLQVALGAMVSGAAAGAACDGLAGCLQAAKSGGWDLRALNPLREADATQAGRAAGAVLQLVHQALAVAAAGVVATLAAAAWRCGARTMAAVLAALLALQWMLGAVGLRPGPPMALVLLHNLLALALLGAVVRLLPPAASR